MSRPYAQYRESGVEWLSQLPTSWSVRPLRSLATTGKNSFTDGDWVETPYITEEGIRLLQTGNVGIGSFREQGFRYIAPETLDEFDCTEVMPGDVLICRLAEPVGRACLAPDLGVRMITSVDVCILKASPEVSSKFVVYALSSPEYLGHMEGQCRGGTRDRVSRSFLGRVRVPIPPLPEQRAIAAFLDRETGKIDALVAEQRRLIALLKEKRQAVISNAVTKGLDPTAPMKPSGIDWLGDIPAHWDLGRLKHDLAFLTSGSRGWAAHYADEGALFIRIGNLTRETLDLSLEDIQRVDVPEGAEGERTLVRRGDLLFSITAYLGSVAVVPGDLETAYVSQHVALARLRQNRLYPKWAGYVTLSLVGRNYLDEQGYGGTKIQLALDDVANIVMPMPPLEDQERILRYIDTTTDKLDALISEAETAINLLQERRSALISAAVTGKINVRGLATGATEAA